MNRTSVPFKRGNGEGVHGSIEIYNEHTNISSVFHYFFQTLVLDLEFFSEFQPALVVSMNVLFVMNSISVRYKPCNGKDIYL